MDKPWYNKGLKFHCTGCGNCCTGAPGFVWLNEEDIERFCLHLKLSREEFLKRYTRKIGKKISLLEDKKTFDCIFLKNRRCTAYEGRPAQCRTYPWWASNLKSEEEWLETAAVCEGINHADGVIIPFEEIQAQLKKSKEEEKKTGKLNILP
jgi:uncharacterized protein